jgi:hypothetical protein
MKIKRNLFKKQPVGVCWFWPPGKGFQLLAVVKKLCSAANFV